MTLIGAPAAVYIWGPSTRYLLTNYNLQIEYVVLVLPLSIYTPPTSQLVQHHSVLPSMLERGHESRLFPASCVENKRDFCWVCHLNLLSPQLSVMLRLTQIQGLLDRCVLSFALNKAARNPIFE